MVYSSHAWGAAMNKYRLSREDRPRQHVGELPLIGESSGNAWTTAQEQTVIQLQHRLCCGYLLQAA